LVFGSDGLALALAALWGLHPLLTESVTNVVGRADLLAAFGVLAGLLCHARAAGLRGRRKLVWLAALAAAQAVGIFAKENAVVLPGVMLLLDLAWWKRATWRMRLPGYLAAALPLAVYFLLRSRLHASMAIAFTDNPLVAAGFWTARITALKVIGSYIGLFLWPATLSADYSYNCVPVLAWPPAFREAAKVFLALAACLALGLVAARRTRKPLFLFGLFFFLTLSPVSNLIVLVGNIKAERFLYLPSICLAGCLVAAAAALVRRLNWKRTAALTLTLSCLALGARTYARNFDWQDEFSLWSSAVQACPESARAHINLGFLLSPVPDRLSETIAEYETAVRIEPGLAEAHYDLGTALLRMPGRMRLRNIRPRCASNPAWRKRITTWEPRWRRCPAACRRPLPSGAPHWPFDPITRERTTTSATLSPKPAGCRKRSPNTRRHYAPGRTSPKCTIISA
jgi:protein O-mannosyl-transferase